MIREERKKGKRVKVRETQFTVSGFEDGGGHELRNAGNSQNQNNSPKKEACKEVRVSVFQPYRANSCQQPK